MLAHDAFGDPSYDDRVTLRADALAAHQLTDLLVELVDQLLVSVRRA